MNKDTNILLERALVIIMQEWGYSRKRALEWLSDDAEDWTPPAPRPAIRPGAFIQVTRRTEVHTSPTTGPVVP